MPFTAAVCSSARASVDLPLPCAPQMPTTIGVVPDAASIPEKIAATMPGSGSTILQLDRESRRLSPADTVGTDQVPDDRLFDPKPATGRGDTQARIVVDESVLRYAVEQHLPLLALRRFRREPRGQGDETVDVG